MVGGPFPKASDFVRSPGHLIPDLDRAGSSSSPGEGEGNREERNDFSPFGQVLWNLPGLHIPGVPPGGIDPALRLRQEGPGQTRLCS